MVFAVAARVLTKRRLLPSALFLSRPFSLSGSFLFPGSCKPCELPVTKSPFYPVFNKIFCFGFATANHDQGPAAIDYSSLLREEEFHKLADATISDLQEKLEEYGDNVQIDGFDVDYGNQVLTLKLGNLGTFVLNKQAPNRQIWLSSPMSGPSRFDWDGSTQVWIYRRTKENLLNLLETELEHLCGKPISLS